MTNEEIMAALAEPFALDEIKHKPQVVSGNRAMCITYVDARVVMDRLDEVFGVGGWGTSYQAITDGVICKLRVKVDGEWVEHQDVGSFSEQPDDGDKVKAAFSDSLKRVAVHIGIGRYLYRLPQSWCDYDPVKKKIVKPPTLPSWALPRPSANGSPQQSAPPPKPAPKAEPPPPANAMPKTGEELAKRIKDYDVRLARQGVCNLDDLRAYVERHAAEAKFPADMKTWSAAQIKIVVGWVKAFEAEFKKPPPPVFTTIDPYIDDEPQSEE